MTKVCSKMLLGGVVEAPPSKSAQQRAIACAAMAEGRSVLAGGKLSADSEAALGLARALGAKVEIHGAFLEIEGAGRFAHMSDSSGGASPKEQLLELDCGESGLCMRMYSPIAALFDFPVTMTGHGSLAKRPMKMVTEPLSSMGVSCESLDGRIPLTIRGPLHGGSFEVDAGESSQFLTGLLMALPLARDDSTVRVSRATSRGYLDLTLEICRAFGVEVDKKDEYRTFGIRGGQRYRAANFEVEGDWSAAAFLAVAGAIASGEAGVEIRGLRKNSAQPDKAVVDVLAACGAEIEQGESGIWVRSRALRAFSFDATECPDLFPPLAALAAACDGQSRIRGAHRLRGKESDRAATLKALLESLGIGVGLEGDEIVIVGGTISGGEVHSAGDHRIAMAAAVLSLLSAAPISVVGAECVSKSWPDFFQDLESLRER